MQQLIIVDLINLIVLQKSFTISNSFLQENQDTNIIFNMEIYQHIFIKKIVKFQKKSLYKPPTVSGLYINLSYSLQIIKVKDKLSWGNVKISDNGKHFAYNSDAGKIVINNKEIDENSFSLVYSKDSNSFCWLTLNGKEVYKKEYLLKD